MFGSAPQGAADRGHVIKQNNLSDGPLGSPASASDPGTPEVCGGDPDPFTDAYVEAVRGFVVGDPADGDTSVGPLITEAARSAVEDAVTQATPGRRHGRNRRRTPRRRGWFLQPTVVTDLTPDAMLAREEVFGPIAAVLPADDVDDAVAITNGVDHGLVTAAFTRDLGRAIDLMNRIDTGLLKVNAPTSGVDIHAPFGGEKASSMGSA